MRQTNEIFIPIPKVRNTHVKIEINEDDVTGRVTKSNFTYPVTSGIGTFEIILSNSNGQLSGLYSNGNIIKFYADNTDSTTLQFWGRIDYVKENISKDGQFLEIKGRHRSYLLNETLICYSAEDMITSQILKDIIDKLPGSYGFTYTNVSTTTDSMNVEWNYKPFWECVMEICRFAGYDCYVDNDLDFHYFEENSIVNTEEALVEGQNVLDSKDWGTNSYYEKTRVTVLGQGKDGLPIIHTAISPDEGEDIREIFINDSSVNNYASIKNIAEAKLFEFTNRTPQAIVKSFGLETIRPGENIWVLIPRQEIHGQYKISKISHNFGTKMGGWRTECLVEQEEEGIAKVIENISKKGDRASSIDNINKLNYSLNFDFDVNSGGHTNTEITDGVLKTDGSATGTWVSPSESISITATDAEFRVVGESLPGTNYFVSADAGGTWKSITHKELIDFSPQGNTLRIKVELNSADTQINSLVLLYS